MKKQICIVILLLVLTACGGPAGKLVKQYGGPKTLPDVIPARSIVLLHPASGEKLNVIYFYDGSYDKAALKKINQLFRDRRSNEVYKIDPELIDFLVDIRTRLMLPPTVVFEILSGYRSAVTNGALARQSRQVAKESLHKFGWAVDFRISGVGGSAIAEIAKTMQRGGVSFYRGDNHVHIDIGNIRTWAAR